MTLFHCTARIFHVKLMNCNVQHTDICFSLYLFFSHFGIGEPDHVAIVLPYCFPVMIRIHDEKEKVGEGKS